VGIFRIALSVLPMQSTALYNRPIPQSAATTNCWRRAGVTSPAAISLSKALIAFSETARENEEIVLPEMLAVIEEQPSQSESKPVLRRRRVKHEISFRDRLLKNAQDAREQAARLPAGPARERLLLKARRSETAADIDTWVSSPGSPPPDNLDLMKKPRA
jgi:hypothetical protein